ncbi:hypothetical protein [Parasitella parasitica]|uniref:WRKY domain-containing protein n=1 Tax=Parasitella parasitica TaxID=35722 RepID=A0A0B7MX04_9FUNG|nr:hypothetical protein [Parasitella parasitica]
MNIQALTSQKSYSNSNKNGRNYLNACPSDDAGLLRYSSSPPPPPPVVVSPLYSYHRESASPPSAATDLQSVVSKYHANPELLKLILASKVEEDKRRTEEAKLKAKELDLYIKNQQEYYTLNQNHQQEAFIVQQRRRRSSSSSNSSASSSSHHNSNAGNSMNRRIAPYSRPIVRSTPSRRNSSAPALLSVNQLSINNANSTQMLSASAPVNTNSFPSAATLSFNNNRSQENVAKISRRRRSMQAITKIVETTEFPYDDRHFWKNNGNTVQKKTGCKSVYYKCANSCKGCPVNKTVVEQPNGSYIIKYRGDHISECSQVEHIRDL